MKRAKLEKFLLLIILGCTMAGCIGIVVKFIQYDALPWVDPQKEAEHIPASGIYTRSNASSSSSQAREARQIQSLQQRAASGARHARSAGFR